LCRHAGQHRRDAAPVAFADHGDGLALWHATAPASLPNRPTTQDRPRTSDV
jgi:hypothetical protein